MGEQGYFDGQRVQLIRGEIIEMPPIGHAHFQTLCWAAKQLSDLFGPEFFVRPQGPVNIGNDSAPEPDLAVVAGAIGTHTDHPTTALLAIEVSDSTLSVDRKLAPLYASAGIPEYWILNVRRRCVELYRHPIRDDTDAPDFRYGEMRIVSGDESLTPLALPGKPILVSSLFPPNI